MKNTQSKVKPIKIGKQPGTTYCFGSKDYTKNFRPEKVKMIFFNNQFYIDKLNTYFVKSRKDTEDMDPKKVRTKIIDQLRNQNVPFVELKNQYF